MYRAVPRPGANPTRGPDHNHVPWEYAIMGSSEHPRKSIHVQSVTQLPTRREVQQAYAAVQKSLRENTTDLSHEALAERSDTSNDYQSRLERAQRCPNLWVFIKISIAMDVDPVLVLSMVLRRLQGER